MQETLRSCSNLSLLLVICLYGCASSVRAPVDSRDNTPAAQKQAAYSQSNAPASSAKQSSDYHVVIKGDTLYSIAWRYNHDYRDVARWNDISNNYVIYPGQFIRLKPDPKKATQLQAGPIVSRKNTSSDPNTLKTPQLPDKVKTNTGPTVSSATNDKIIWLWPTQGKLVKSNTPTSMKGVDIAGYAGQRVNAAASGDVVYSGGGLLGYGKLIIIKHNDNFLSAYAHNEKLYAKEGEKVKAGQQIATMGLGNKGRPILHFEIRKDGTPENPLQHLPKNRS